MSKVKSAVKKAFGYRPKDKSEKAVKSIMSINPLVKLVQSGKYPFDKVVDLKTAKKAGLPVKKEGTKGHLIALYHKLHGLTAGKVYDYSLILEGTVKRTIGFTEKNYLSLKSGLKFVPVEYAVSDSGAINTGEFTKGKFIKAGK